MSSPWPRDPSPDDLKLICYLLNGEGELPGYIPQPKHPLPPAIRGVQPELRRLVEAWQAVGRSSQKLLESDSTLARILQRMTVPLVPTQEGGLSLASPSLQLPQRHQLPTEPEQWKDFALAHFVNLLLNPHRDMLGGPCLRPRCGRYFVKKSMRRRFYCAPRCRMAVGARKFTRKREHAERQDKLRRVDTAGREWVTARTRLDWKRWVCRREPDLTPKFLTRALNKGELQEPKKG
jgi:hypothetical protein